MDSRGGRPGEEEPGADVGSDVPPLDGELPAEDEPAAEGEPRTEGEQRALAALTASGMAFEVTRHGPVRSLEEAAAARGVSPGDIVKTLVVRRGEGDYVFVLVPGGREISWPKLRAHLGVSRLSMPDAATAREVTGYERGTITPFGALTAWPVVADADLAARTVSIGAGAHGVAFTIGADALVAALDADRADVTDLS
jgi:Cys-tRNA(Pro)/Cys-tRNA(Cys) deacylase